VRRCELGASGLGSGPVAVPCEHDSETFYGEGLTFLTS